MVIWWLLGRNLEKEDLLKRELNKLFTTIIKLNIENNIYRVAINLKEKNEMNEFKEKLTTSYFERTYYHSYENSLKVLKKEIWYFEERSYTVAELEVFKKRVNAIKNKSEKVNNSLKEKVYK